MAQRRPWIEQQVESKQLLAHVATTFFRVQGSSKKLVPWLRECCRQSQVVVVSKGRNKIHQTWGPPPFSPSLGSKLCRLDDIFFSHSFRQEQEAKNETIHE